MKNFLLIMSTALLGFGVISCSSGSSGSGASTPEVTQSVVSDESGHTYVLSSYGNVYAVDDVALSREANLKSSATASISGCSACVLMGVPSLVYGEKVSSMYPDPDGSKVYYNTTKGNILSSSSIEAIIQKDPIEQANVNLLLELLPQDNRYDVRLHRIYWEDRIKRRELLERLREEDGQISEIIAAKLGDSSQGNSVSSVESTVVFSGTYLSVSPLNNLIVAQDAYGNIVQLNPDSGAVLRIGTTTEPTISHPFVEDESGNVWSVTESSLNNYNISTGLETDIPLMSNLPTVSMLNDSVVNDTISARPISISPDGTQIIVPSQNGLQIYDTITSQWMQGSIALDPSDSIVSLIHQNFANGDGVAVTTHYGVHYYCDLGFTKACKRTDFPFWRLKH